MYAVIKTGGCQHSVAVGDKLTIDKVDGEAGSLLKFEQVLMLGGEVTTIGTPLVAGASVEAVIEKQTRNPKITIFKYKRRKNYKRKKGHKQPVTVVEIKKINSTKKTSAK